MYKKKAEVLHPYYVILSRDTRFDDDRRPAPDYIRLMDADERSEEHTSELQSLYS